MNAPSFLYPWSQSWLISLSPARLSPPRPLNTCDPSLPSSLSCSQAMCDAFGFITAPILIQGYEIDHHLSLLVVSSLLSTFLPAFFPLFNPPSFCPLCLSLLFFRPCAMLWTLPKLSFPSVDTKNFHILEARPQTLQTASKGNPVPVQSASQSRVIRKTVHLSTTMTQSYDMTTIAFTTRNASQSPRYYKMSSQAQARMVSRSRGYT